MEKIIQKFEGKIYNRFHILKGIEPPSIQEQEAVIIKKTGYNFHLCDSCMYFSYMVNSSSVLCCKKNKIPDSCSLYEQIK